MNHRAAPRRVGGQAMVEYAILLLLLLMLVAGGIEISLAAFGSQRASSAAQAGVEQWVYAVGGAGTYTASGATFAIDRSPIDLNLDGIANDAVGLGSHDTVDAFARPSCDSARGNPYDDGLPDDSTTQGGNAFYLFNPKPVDITACTGQDATQPTRTRQAMLIEALPPLNRALYTLYQTRCADAGNADIDCADTTNVAQTFLRLPGRLDGTTDTVILGLLDSDPYSPTFQMPSVQLPTFELECAIAGSQGFGACDSADAPADLCWDIETAPDSVPLACDIRLRVRYRYVFNSLLQFPFVWWNSPLPPEALALLDTGPGGSPGVLGGEVGRGGVRLFQRTFQGCWETVTAAPSAGMQGNRTLRNCN
jgi:hypothetical protein